MGAGLGLGAGATPLMRGGELRADKTGWNSWYKNAWARNTEVNAKWLKIGKLKKHFGMNQHVLQNNRAEVFFWVNEPKRSGMLSPMPHHKFVTNSVRAHGSWLPIGC